MAIQIASVTDKQYETIVKHFSEFEPSSTKLIIISNDSELAVLDDSCDLLIYCHPGSSGKILQHITQQTERKVQVFIDRDANFSLATIQNLPGDVGGVSHLSIHLSTNAQLKLIECNVGGKTLTAKTNIVLDDHAHAENVACFMCGSDQTYDIKINVYHKGKDGYSSLVTKGIVSGKAHAKCANLIDVGYEASGTDGYQDNNGLLLNDNVKLQFLPLLEIRNPDVKCSHGAKITHIDETQMFYLQSRGLPKPIAQGIIIEGFFFDKHFSQYAIKGLREELQALVKTKFLG